MRCDDGTRNRCLEHGGQRSSNYLNCTGFISVIEMSLKNTNLRTPSICSQQLVYDFIKSSGKKIYEIEMVRGLVLKLQFLFICG